MGRLAIVLLYYSKSADCPLNIRPTTSRIIVDLLKMTTTPANRLQRYDLAGGCNGIDAEFSLPACTSSDLLNAKEFIKITDKLRREYCLYRFGREDGTIELPFDEADRDFARGLWNSRKDDLDLWRNGSRKLRARWHLGPRLGLALLWLQEELPIVKTGGARVRLPIDSLTHKQRCEWLLALLEYEMHIRQSIA
ncbi:hypothetical protein SLS62_008344 [Diatrype stigma]|uniref:Uncharacterized protein n=1 Tax=Diatrype stigma TaxID=117547 RepID=A0AAN9YP10_9PEZI